MELRKSVALLMPAASILALSLFCAHSSQAQDANAAPPPAALRDQKLGTGDED